MKTYLLELSEAILPLIVLVILSIALGFMLGAGYGQSLTINTAVESGCAYFDSGTGHLKWKTLK